MRLGSGGRVEVPVGGMPALRRRPRHRRARRRWTAVTLLLRVFRWICDPRSGQVSHIRAMSQMGTVFIHGPTALHIPDLRSRHLIKSFAQLPGGSIRLCSVWRSSWVFSLELQGDPRPTPLCPFPRVKGSPITGGTRGKAAGSGFVLFFFFFFSFFSGYLCFGTLRWDH